MADDPNTRERILHTASGLFQRQGYHATGLNQVLAEGKAPKGSLYFHFPRGKEQLAAEAITAGANDLRDELRDALDAAHGPVDGLAMVADFLGARLVATGFRAGCPVATVALDMAGESDTIRTACAAGYASWGVAIAQRLAGWGVPAGRRESLATVVIAAFEGALLLARVRHEVAPLHEVAELVGGLVRGECRATTGL
jgi:TetR/AcrR family transcriptional repressor of lmrAB and yxaGH operons